MNCVECRSDLHPHFRQMVFFDNLDQTTAVVLNNVAVNEPIDASQFEFVVPDDVDVVGTPAIANDAR